MSDELKFKCTQSAINILETVAVL